MKITENKEHNSVEIDFEGVKPSEEQRAVLKAYGFWWFQKEKIWCHTLAVDAEFFREFIERRVRPMVAAPAAAPTAADIKVTVANMSDEERQSLLADLMKQQGTLV